MPSTIYSCFRAMIMVMVFISMITANTITTTDDSTTFPALPLPSTTWTTSSITSKHKPVIDPAPQRLSDILAKLAKPTTMKRLVRKDNMDYLNQTITSGSIITTFHPTETTCVAPFNDWVLYQTTTLPDGSVSRNTMYADYLCINGALVPTTTTSDGDAPSASTYSEPQITSKVIVTNMVTTTTVTPTFTLPELPQSATYSIPRIVSTATMDLPSAEDTPQFQLSANTSTRTAASSSTSSTSDLKTFSATFPLPSPSFASATNAQPSSFTLQSKTSDAEPGTMTPLMTASLLTPGFTPKKRSCTP